MCTISGMRINNEHLERVRECRRNMEFIPPPKLAISIKSFYPKEWVKHSSGLKNFNL